MKTRVWGTRAKSHQNLRIQPELLEEAHKFAFIGGVTLSEYIRAAIREKVQRDKEEDERLERKKELSHVSAGYQRPR